MEIAGILGGPDAAPGLRVVQVKEKFGALRYYMQDVPAPQAEAVQLAIRRAEETSVTVCERCGAPGRLRETPEGYWYTACDRHTID